MKIPVILSEGRIEMSEYHKMQIRKALKDTSGPIRAEIQTLLPESRHMRAYVMGSLLPLLVYLDGNDYKDTKICEYYFEHYKTEMSPEAVKIAGKIHLFGKSTKGSKALKVFAEKLQDYLSEHHGIDYDSKVTNPDFYKEWRDTMSMDTTEDFLDYCKKLKHLK